MRPFSYMKLRFGSVCSGIEAAAASKAWPMCMAVANPDISCGRMVRTFG